jgi:hypothetical protein
MYFQLKLRIKFNVFGYAVIAVTSQDKTQFKKKLQQL